MILLFQFWHAGWWGGAPAAIVIRPTGTLADADPLGTLADGDPVGTVARGNPIGTLS